jgi:hypothetical protein
MRCWPQHLLQTYPIWQSLLMDRNIYVRHWTISTKDSHDNKEAEGGCVCMCIHVCTHMHMHAPTVLFQWLGCKSDIPYSPTPNYMVAGLWSPSVNIYYTVCMSVSF